MVAEIAFIFWIASLTSLLVSVNAAVSVWVPAGPIKVRRAWTAPTELIVGFAVGEYSHA